MQVQITIQKENELVQNFPQPLKLTLNSTLKQKIQSLAETLEASPHIAQDLKKQLTEWKIQTLKPNSYFDSLSSNDEKEAAAEILSMLFFDVIRPAIAQSKSNKALDDIYSYKKEFKKVLKPLLPANKGVKTFLAECDPANDKVIEFMLKKILIDQKISALDNWLTKNSSELTQKYSEHFEHIKQELCQFVNHWEDCADEAADQAQVIIKRLEILSDQLITLKMKSITICEDIFIEEAKLDLMMAECSEILSKGVK